MFARFEEKNLLRELLKGLCKLFETFLRMSKELKSAIEHNVESLFYKIKTGFKDKSQEGSFYWKKILKKDWMIIHK